MSILSTVRDLGRLREITGVLAHYGFDQLIQDTGLSSLVSKKRVAKVAELSRAQRIRCVLEELGPSFIKLGQIMSTRPDLLPEDVITELQKLQEATDGDGFTKELLRTTGIGKVVGKLRKSADQTVAKAAKALVASWKQLLV